MVPSLQIRIGLHLMEREVLLTVWLRFLRLHLIQRRFPQTLRKLMMVKSSLVLRIIWILSILGMVLSRRQKMQRNLLNTRLLARRMSNYKTLKGLSDTWMFQMVMLKLVQKLQRQHQYLQPHLLMRCRQRELQMNPLAHLIRVILSQKFCQILKIVALIQPTQQYRLNKLWITKTWSYQLRKFRLWMLKLKPMKSKQMSEGAGNLMG
ncbi:unknown protein [Oryza sativa Japonica Group]|uniref:Uncharacterized protein n=1 Tax=Oryza sativa subsp. japonica TaxID=39947 RepID=Q5ZAH2_ORYSJ|nr:unknown protein [Oryza sativa Japonica Group]